MRTSPSELLLRQRFGALKRALPAAQEGDPSSLHQARVATRRLREALPLVGGGRQKKIERRVRRLTRALGPVRELDVALQILDELERSPDVPRAAIRRLQHAVTDERRALHDEMCRTVERCDVRKVEKRALNAWRKAQDSGTSGPEAAAIRERAARRAERLQTALQAAAGLYLPDRLHDVRVAVKKLRYALELLPHANGTRAEVRIRTLKKAQDLLGRMHDFEVLIARTRGVQGAPSAPTLKLSADLDKLVRRLENECRQLHGHYISLRKSLLAVCDQVQAAARRGAA